MALADAPTFNANKPLEADEDDLGSRAINDAYEPGSVEKVLTVASLIDAGKAPRARVRVPPCLARQDRVIGDWFDHGNIRLTLAGVIAKSSNIGTVLAADAFSPVELVGYLQKFGLGQRTDIGMRGESPGILTPGDVMTSQTKDRVAFGQSLSVNAAPDGRGRQHHRQRRRARLAEPDQGLRHHRGRHRRRHRHGDGVAVVSKKAASRPPR